MTDFNKDYKMDDEMLKILRDQGFVKYMSSLSETPDKRETLAADTVTNLIYSGINSLIFANPAIMLFGLIPEAIDIIKEASS